MMSPPAEDRPLPARRFPRPRPSLGLAALSGLLLIGAFPHLDCGWLAWVALVPFLRTFPHRTWRAAIAHGVAFGLVFFGGLFYWIAVFAAHAVGPALGAVTWAGTMLSQSATCVVFALGAQALARRTWGRGPWLWGVPALWTLFEWARQFGILGTTWGDLAFTQHHVLPLLQLSKLTGPWGLSFLIVLVNVCLAEALPTRMGTPSLRPLLAASIVVLAALIYGLRAGHAEHLRPTVVAAALQGNINQDIKEITPAYVQRVLDTFTAQSRAAKARGAILTVWPETAVPGYLRNDPTLLFPIAQAAQENGQTLLVGARDYLPAQKKDTNTLFLVTPQGTLTGAYSKQHLVPFGEYVPLRAWFPLLDRLHLSIYDMAPGAAHQPLLTTSDPRLGSIGAGICYDSTYAGLMRDQVRRGANLLVVTTDDTWFGRTAAANQHAAMAALDACATDRYLVRCAATGISQIIAPTGQVIAAAPLFEPAVVAAPVQVRTTTTPYVRYGDWMIGLCGAITLIALVRGGMKTQRFLPSNAQNNSAISDI